MKMLARSLNNLLLAGILCSACTSPDRSVSTVESDAPWTSHAVTPSDDGVMRVLVLHDMEGLAGQEVWESFIHGLYQYKEGQDILAADINAVVDGLFDAGADEVHVVDGHGSTNPDPDYRNDLMDPRVTRVVRDEWFDPYSDLVLDGGYDAVAVVGMHARWGTGGFAAHTYTLGTEIYVNGIPVTETEIVALSFGRMGIPVIFASGDQVLGDNLSTMPWIEYVTVKDSTDPKTTIARNVDSVRVEMKAAASRALENLGDMQYMQMNLPGTMQAGAHYPASLAGLNGIPGIAWEDGRVTWRGDDFGELYEATRETLGAVNYLNAHLRTMYDQDPLYTQQFGFLEPLVFAWLIAERELAETGSADPEPIEDPAPPTTEKPQFHGAN